VQARFEPGYAPSELWTPLSIRAASVRMNATFVQTIGRLKPGVSTTQAVSELAGLLESVRPDVPMMNAWTVGVVELREAEYGSRRPALVILLTTVLALILIATGNLANLTLADVMSRRSEFALRAALGASRRRLAAPEIAESLVIAIVGGCLGLAFGTWLAPALLVLDPSSTLNTDRIAIDWRVIVCALSIATLVMVAAGVAPVFRFASPGLALDIASGPQRATGGVAAARTRVALVTTQTALALVLLSSGGLVVATFQRAASTDPGFDPTNVVTAQLRLPEHVFPTDLDRANFIDRLLERVRATPGVVHAGTTLNRFDLEGGFQTLVQIEDRPAPDGQPHTVQFRRVTPGYFETLRIALIAGRFFERRDRAGGQPVAIVSRGFARRFWGTDFVVGRKLRRGTAPGWITVVGVVDDVRDLGLDKAPIATVYTSFYQASNAAAPVALVVRTKGDPRVTIAAIKRAVWEVDAKQSLANIATLEEFFRMSLGPQRFRAALVAICGAIGLLLATIGTYGITARSVVERTREVGIRLALGGRPVGVWWAICRTSMRAVVAGALAGALVSRVATAGLGMMLPEVAGSTWEFTTGAAAVLLLVGGLAALVAGRAATLVEPLRALRGE
jgi:putative ABC transport system permease protein